MAAATFGFRRALNLRQRDCESDGLASCGAKYVTEGEMESAELCLRGILILTVATFCVDAGSHVLPHPVLGVPDGVHERALLGKKQQKYADDLHATVPHGFVWTGLQMGEPHRRLCPNESVAAHLFAARAPLKLR